MILRLIRPRGGATILLFRAPRKRLIRFFENVEVHSTAAPVLSDRFSTGLLTQADCEMPTFRPASRGRTILASRNAPRNTITITRPFGELSRLADTLTGASQLVGSSAGDTGAYRIPSLWQWSMRLAVSNWWRAQGGTVSAVPGANNRLRARRGGRDELEETHGDTWNPTRP